MNDRTEPTPSRPEALPLTPAMLALLDYYGALDDGATQSWQGGAITSPTLDPALQPGSPSITQKSWDGTVPMPA